LQFVHIGPERWLVGVFLFMQLLISAVAFSKVPFGRVLFSIMALFLLVNLGIYLIDAHDIDASALFSYVRSRPQEGPVVSNAQFLIRSGLSATNGLFELSETRAAAGDMTSEGIMRSIGENGVKMVIFDAKV